MDAHNELLLSGGVCRQLGIILYHPDMKIRQHKINGEEQFVTVPTILLLECISYSLCEFPQDVVPVQLKGGSPTCKPMLMERDPAVEESIDTLLQPSEVGIAHLILSNSA